MTRWEDRPSREREMESYFARRVRERGGMSWHICPVAGFPDRLVLLPGRELELVELKRSPADRLRRRQEIVHREIASIGGRVFSVRSWDEIEAYLR